MKKRKSGEVWQIVNVPPSSCTDRTHISSVSQRHSCLSRDCPLDPLAVGSALVTGFGQIGYRQKWCVSFPNLGLVIVLRTWMKTWQWPSFSQIDEDNVFGEKHSTQLGRIALLKEIVQKSLSLTSEDYKKERSKWVSDWSYYVWNLFVTEAWPLP